MPFPSRRILLSGLCAVLVSPLAAAADDAPFVFGTFNQATLARFAPLPTPQADSTGSGYRVAVDWSNEYVADENGQETVLLDGESLRLGLSGRVAVGSWLFGAELPLLFNGGGVLDGLIENWHSWFSLPNGGREERPHGKYTFRYTDNGQTLLDVEHGHDGIGDARLFAARCNDSGGCLRTMLQLPTGNADDLLGGGLGAAAWYEQGFRAKTLGPWSGALAAGVSGVHGSGPLKDRQEHFIPFGWASLGYSLTSWLDAGAQFYLHAPLYKDSDLDTLSRVGGQLSFGFRARSASGISTWLGIQEDLITESSPDFSIHIAADFH
ncbi:DUF3187 family protein [Solimonas marina]|uniref:DUF3187 family protein n=1 Tax=Solimonas marina TaxID=2714601 RepID=A0A970B8Z8_9GAMM|nr:DUF3187 family protein [Solimonas marina]NKF21906.1 DUF3187 family protein [Solimonas marina]